jgi:uncharacterized protein (TIGR02246 family)
VAGLWSDDGRYLDDEGNTYIGRTAIEKIFGALLANNGKPKVEIAIEKMRFPAGNVALVEGIVKRSPAANVPAVPMTRFSMVFEQKGTGPWQIAAATETPMVSQKAASDGSGLGSLNWLIGDWTAKRNGAEVRMKAEWVPTKNFIFMTYHIAKAGEPEKRETQVIGWDARTQTPISWLFDSSGGFGEGKWTRSSGQWLVTAEAVDRQGRDVTAVNVISQNGPDSFTWQSVNRRVNGTLVEDTQPVKVERVGTSTANK